MLDTREIEEARQLARELRAAKDERRARLVERLITRVLRETPLAADVHREWMSTGDASRLLGVSGQTIKNWVQKGALEGHRLGGRVKVSRRSVMDQLDRLQPSPAPQYRMTQDQLEDARRRQEEVVAALPEELRVRVETLLARRASGEELTAAEEVELRRLAREASLRATEHLDAQLLR